MPQWVRDGDPVEEAHVYLDRPQAAVGVWCCRPGVLAIDAYPFDEFCVVLEGHCELTAVGMPTERFGVGDAFIIHRGFEGTWSMPEGLRKFYVEMRV